MEAKLGPVISAGFLVKWYVSIDWQRTEITLYNDRDEASALYAVMENEKFEIWELEGKQETLIGKFHAVSVNDKVMVVRLYTT